MSTLTNDGRVLDSYVRTHTGLKFSHRNPRPEAICIEDIAHSLSQQCRFTGHTRVFYSTAQHAVYVSWICPQEYAFWALNHDDEEFVTNDCSSPFKYLPEMLGFREIGRHIQSVIIAKLGLPAGEPPSVKEADTRMLVTEQRDLMPCSDSSRPGVTPVPYRIRPWSCHKAKRVFLLRFAELSGGHLTWYQRLYLRAVRGRW